jgi:hypothetical protein
MKSAGWILVSMVALSALVSPARAQVPVSEDAPSWKYVFAPYFLMPHMDGTVGLGGVEGDVNASPSDIFEKLQGGFMAYFEAHDPTWGIGVDYLYMNLGGSGTTRTGTVDADLKQTGISAIGMYRVSPWAEVVAGVQWNSIDAALKGTGTAAVDASMTPSWTDPMVGARVTTPGEGKWKGSLLATIGGFGVGSDFAWQAYPVVSYRFSPLITIGAAYRVMSMDYTSGSGADEFKYDVTTFGPEIGVGFHF